MNTPLQHGATLVARTLLALIFVVSGLGKITGFSGTAGYMASQGIAFAEIALVGAIVVELVGGLMLLIGFKARWAALAIFLFIIPTTVMFHNPAGLSGQEAQNQMIHSMKNLAIMGGMLMVTVFGPGAWSLDRK